jgi:SAM-dependent methyltransferase
MNMTRLFIEKLHITRRFLSTRGLIRDHVKCGASVIPPKYLRFGGKEFKEDAFFLTSGRLEAQRLTEKCAVTSESRILDIGCGVGRLAIGILNQMSKPPLYWGVDVDPGSIKWCQRHISRDHSGFHFTHVNVVNRRYNAQGAVADGSFRFPFADGLFDAIYLYSVFSHMMPGDIKTYLAEFRRLLVPRGQVFFTAFAEERVPEVMENPPGYRMNWSGPLHCVRYQKEFLESLVAQAGFEVRMFEYGRETDGQSGFYLSLAGSHEPRH